MTRRLCAIVTGSSKGIGKEIAIKLAKCGFNIVINYRENEKEALEVEKTIKNEGVYAIAVKANVCKFEEAHMLINKAIQTFERIDVLVNNAGITRDRLITRMEEEDFDSVIDTNLKGCFNCIRHVSPIMIKQKRGCIVNISSICALSGNVGQSNYSASKAGIIGLTKSISKELGSRGITVNAVAPGFIETEMTQVLNDKVKNEMFDKIPVRRFGKAEDVGELVAFLCSDKATYITGQVIRIDGGMVL